MTEAIAPRTLRVLSTVLAGTRIANLTGAAVGVLGTRLAASTAGAVWPSGGAVAVHQTRSAAIFSEIAAQIVGAVGVAPAGAAALGLAVADPGAVIVLEAGDAAIACTVTDPIGAVIVDQARPACVVG